MWYCCLYIVGLRVVVGVFRCIWCWIVLVVMLLLLYRCWLIVLCRILLFILWIGICCSFSGWLIYLNCGGCN